MASVTTSEFLKSSTQVEVPPFSLIEHKGLVARLTEELNRAAKDLAHNPRRFLRDIFTYENKDLKRRRLIYAGLGLGLFAHFIFIAVIFIADWVKPVRSEETPEQRVVMLNPNDFKMSSGTHDVPKSDMPSGGGKGGGGGGDPNSVRPPSRGPLPKMSSVPPVVKLTAPKIPNPTLPVLQTVVGPDTTAPPTVNVGIPTGEIDAPPSPGKGSGTGIGGSDGDGAGVGKGPGSGPGKGGGSGGKEAGSTEGTGPGGSGPVNWSQLRSIPGNTDVKFTHAIRPIPTPEAQANKVSGVIVLRATFHADGVTISDIDVVTTVPYMTEAGIEALKRCKFRPAMINGIPVTVRRVIVRIKVTAGSE